jgi:type II secretory pathway component PulM
MLNYRVWRGGMSMETAFASIKSWLAAMDEACGVRVKAIDKRATKESRRARQKGDQAGGSVEVSGR